MKTIQHRAFHFAFPGLLLLALTACGGGGYGGGGGGGGGGATYSVGGMVSGLSGSGLVLRNNDGDDLSVPASGTFTFAIKVANGAAYAVTVYTQPTNPAQTCLVTNGSGTMGGGNVTNVEVNCTTDTVTGTCGIPQATGLTAVGPAEGAWLGALLFPGSFDAQSFHGVIGDNGQANFSARGSGDEMWIGSVLASSDGATSSSLTRYERVQPETPGGLKSVGSTDLHVLIFGSATATNSLVGAYTGAGFNCKGLTLTYDGVYGRSASLAKIAGVYTTTDGFYTLTVTIGSDGQLDGSDTNGCVLQGEVTVPNASKNYYSAVADANSCGLLTGHYTGMMYLSDGAAPNDNAGLNFSLANPDAAIFDTLYR